MQIFGCANHEKAPWMQVHPALVHDWCTCIQQAGQSVSCMCSQVMDFGKHSFQEQLEAVRGASALVGISGSDLVNGIFLPSHGAVVEILPSNRGHQVCTPLS